MRATETAVRRPIMTAMVALIVIILGGVSLLQIPIDLMPDITLPTVTVTTNYRNVSPLDIETLVTEPIERAVARVPGVEEITSSSSEGRSRVRAHFVWGTNLDEAVNDVRSRLDRLRDDLPRDADPPVVFKFDASASPIMFLGVSGNMAQADLRRFAEDTLQYRLERIEGVAAADVRGGLVRQIHVNLLPERINALDLSTEDVVRALEAESQNLPAGNVYQGDHRVIVRTIGEFQNLDEIRGALVARRDGRAIYVRDVATVEDSFEERDHAIRVDGRPGVLMTIIKRPGANTVQVADRMKKEIEVVNEDYRGQGIRVWALIDTSGYIRRSIEQVRSAATYGAVLTVLVLIVFLRNIRSTLIISTAIPLSVVATFAVIYFKGFTLNIMSFGGLALGIGMLVDNAIVVLENIFRHRSGGADSVKAALVGSGEVGSAITASTLTTLVVFLPIVFMTGTVGVMFQQLAWVVFFSLTVSLIVALTVVPVLCAKYLRIRHERQEGLVGRLDSSAGDFFAALDGGYQALLGWALGHRALVILGSAAIFVASLFVYPLVGQEFMPETDEGLVRIRAEMEEGTRIEVMDKAFTYMEQVVRREVPEAQSVLTRFGNYQSSSNEPHRGDMLIRLPPLSERKRSSQDIAQSLRQHLRQIPGLTARPRPWTEAWILRRVGLSDDDRLEINILGHDLERGGDLARQAAKVIETVPGVAETRISRGRGSPEATIHIDRQKAASLGISASQIAQVIRTSLGGQRATLYREKGDEHDILVRLPQRDRQEMEMILDLTVKTPTGKVIPLRSMARLAERRGPVEIERLNQERVVTVRGEPYGRDLESIATDVKTQLRGIAVPAEFQIQIGGDYEEKIKAFRALKWGLILSLILVYMVMAALYESLVDPLIIMFSVPFAGVGIWVTLLLTGTTLNVNSFIGIVMLAGIVVNNAIVLVDYINLKVREDGLSIREAVLMGGRTRLRPILMTTLTTLLALTPMALGLGEGGEAQAPLARAVVGGLTTSTLVTLVLIPTLYAAVKEWKPAHLREFAWARLRLANGRIVGK